MIEKKNNIYKTLNNLNIVKKSFAIAYFIFILIGLMAIFYYVITLYKTGNEFIISKQNTETNFLSSLSTKKNLVLLFITDEEIPKNTNEFFARLRQNYNVFILKSKNFDTEKIKRSDVIICDKKILTNQEIRELDNILKTSKKLILFKNCRNILLDKKIGIKYNGEITLEKNGKYKYEILPNPLIEENHVPLFVPMRTYNINDINCLYDTAIVRLDGHDVLCYDRYNKLVSAFSLKDFFEDEFYYEDYILYKFIMT
jgi:hypothetical protein